MVTGANTFAGKGLLHGRACRTLTVCGSLFMQFLIREPILSRTTGPFRRHGFARQVCIFAKAGSWGTRLTCSLEQLEAKSLGFDTVFVLDGMYTVALEPSETISLEIGSSPLRTVSFRAPA